MFYAHFVLSKKGPLAKVWLAAHWDKKLTKSHVFETDVAKTVDDIISPKVKMALRTSGHLLLGVVRIYSRKQKYLIQDLGEACAKIKMAFRPGIVDLPIEGAVAAGDTITLPEIFQNFESAVQDLVLAADNIETDRYQSRAEDITLRDDLSTNRMLTLSDFQPMDNEFGGMLEDIEVPRKSSLSFQSHASDSSHLAPNNDALPMNNDNNLMDIERQFANRGLEFGDMGGFGEGLQDNLLIPPPLEGEPNIPQIDDINIDTSGVNATAGGGGGGGEPMEVDTIVIGPQEETIRDEGFVLEPLDVTSGLRVRQKRKRKLVIDREKELDGNAIRAQLRDTSDTVRPIVYSGPKRKALAWKDTSTVEYLYHAPTTSHLSSSLLSLVSRNQVPLNPSDAKAFDMSLLTDEGEIPREEVPADTTTNDGGSIIVPLPDNDGEGMMMVDQFDMMDQNGGPPSVGELPPRQEEEEESVARIIPELPDFEEPSTTQPTDGETPQEDSAPSSSDPTGERKRWNKRTQQVLKLIDKGFEQTDILHFTDLTRKCNRKQAASRFYSCLLLGKEGTIELQQREPYSAILITKLSPPTTTTC